jgi:hypothetical protein
LLLAGFKIPFKVTLDSPIEGVLVIFNDSEDAAAALSSPRINKEKAKRNEKSFFTIESQHSRR